MGENMISLKLRVDIALEHYDRMITWVKDQQPCDPADWTKMFAAIDEDWYADSCCYCQVFLNTKTPCKWCPLKGRGGCCGGLWVKMSTSTTWGHWLDSAEKVREYIQVHGNLHIEGKEAQ